jgi:uncharacterized damage-inducible protein DinB
MKSSANLLDVVIEAWERSNRILVNLLRAMEESGLAARATDGSPTVAAMLHHMHHERMISLAEEAPEFAGAVPPREWEGEDSVEAIVAKLDESAVLVARAVRARVEADRPLDRSYDHPILFLQLLAFHEAYHHGQIKLALKAHGCPVPDEAAGPGTWDVWRRRKPA